VTKQYASLLEQVSDRLDSVQSQADADQAAADIQALLKKSDAIAQAARNVDAKGKVSESTQEAAKASSARVAASVRRVNEAGLMTQSLRSAVEQIGLSFEAVASGIGTGRMPPAESALDEAWIDYIETFDKQAELLTTITSAAAAERAIDEIVAIERKRHAALTRIAELGGNEPPTGVPQKYRRHWQAAKDRLDQQDGAVTAALGTEVGRLHELLQQAKAAEPDLEADPFRLSAEVRTAPTMATVTLINNKSVGERHQQMIAHLKQLAGAQHAEAVIEADGTYKTVFAPVPDFDRFVTSINFGDISNRDDASKTFTLTVDPVRFEAIAASLPVPNEPLPGFGRPGQPGYGGPGFRQPGVGPAGGPRPGGAQAYGGIEQQRQAFYGRNGGFEKCVTLILENAPRPGSEEGKALVEQARRVSGAKATADLKIGQHFLLLAPVDDVEALAAKIDFGTVTAIDTANREITIDVAASQVGL
jgi:hypothetical protein